MRHLLFVISSAVVVTACGVEPLLVKNVSAAVERGTHLVRVSYDLSNEADEPAYVTLDAQTNGISIGWDKFRTLGGDVTRLADPRPVACGTGRSLTWNAPLDWPGQRVDNVTFRVLAHHTNGIARIPGVYMKIDLSGGAEAASYPVTYSFAGPDLTDTNSYAKGTLWMRCIGPAAFQMGAQPDDPGRDISGKEYLHTVTLTKAFYIGVFDVTEYQYRQVMGAIPKESIAKGDVYPVSACSYDILRGTTYQWPASDKVEADTFIGRLRAKAGRPRASTTDTPPTTTPTSGSSRSHGFVPTLQAEKDASRSADARRTTGASTTCWGTSTSRCWTGSPTTSAPTRATPWGLRPARGAFCAAARQAASTGTGFARRGGFPGPPVRRMIHWVCASRSRSTDLTTCNLPT